VSSQVRLAVESDSEAFFVLYQEVWNGLCGSDFQHQKFWTRFFMGKIKSLPMAVKTYE
jgi:hypothetical protein